MSCPFYLIHSKEPFLAQEAALSLIQSAQQEKQRAHLYYFIQDPHFDWQEVLQTYRLDDLFTEHKLIDLHLHTSKIGREAHQSLNEWVLTPHPNHLVIIRALYDKSILQKPWAKHIQKSGGLIAPQAPYPWQYQSWILQRAQKYPLKLHSKVVNQLTQYFEGDLVSLAQTLEKLWIHYGEQPIDATMLSDHLHFSVRHEVFALAHTILKGQSTSLLTVFRSLNQNGCDPTLVLWQLGKVVHHLTQLIEEKAENFQSLCQKIGIFKSQIPLYQRAIADLTLGCLHQYTAALHTLDMHYKRTLCPEIWCLLRNLALSLTLRQAPQALPIDAYTS